MFIDEIKDGHFGKKDSLVDIGKGKNIQMTCQESNRTKKKWPDKTGDLLKEVQFASDDKEEACRYEKSLKPNVTKTW